MKGSYQAKTLLLGFTRRRTSSEERGRRGEGRLAHQNEQNVSLAIPKAVQRGKKKEKTRPSKTEPFEEDPHPSWGATLSETNA